MVIELLKLSLRNSKLFAINVRARGGVIRHNPYLDIHLIYPRDKIFVIVSPNFNLGVEFQVLEEFLNFKVKEDIASRTTLSNTTE